MGGFSAVSQKAIGPKYNFLGIVMIAAADVFIYRRSDLKFSEYALCAALWFFHTVKRQKYFILTVSTTEKIVHPVLNMIKIYEKLSRTLFNVHTVYIIQYTIYIYMYSECQNFYPLII